MDIKTRAIQAPWQRIAKGLATRRARARKPQAGAALSNTQAKRIDLEAAWTPGCGRAHLNAAFWSEPFNCLMVGTFNINTSLNVERFRPSFTNFKKNHKFWLVRLNDERYGWAIRWAGSKMPTTTIEVISKTAFPEDYRRGEIKVEIMDKWPDNDVKAWASRIHFFQTFEWGPREANSRLVWDTINHVPWKEKTVLDIGCNFGYHAFQASRSGAQVTGWDANKNVIPVAKTINDHIEMCDVDFKAGHFPGPGQKWDIILCFSVIHQHDPKYQGLQAILEGLRNAARERIFLELIVPSLDGSMSEDAIDKIVGGRALLKYRHIVRCERKIFEIKGDGQ